MMKLNSPFGNCQTKSRPACFSFTRFRSSVEWLEYCAEFALWYARTVVSDLDLDFITVLSFDTDFHFGILSRIMDGIADDIINSPPQ